MVIQYGDELNRIPALPAQSCVTCAAPSQLPRTPFFLLLRPENADVFPDSPPSLSTPHLICQEMSWETHPVSDHRPPAPCPPRSQPPVPLARIIAAASSPPPHFREPCRPPTPPTASFQRTASPAVFSKSPADPVSRCLKLARLHRLWSGSQGPMASTSPRPVSFLRLPQRICERGGLKQHTFIL